MEHSAIVCLSIFCVVFYVELVASVLQKEYILVKPARDAAARAKKEAEALSATECPVHADNEWNIRQVLGSSSLISIVF